MKIIAHIALATLAAAALPVTAVAKDVEPATSRTAAIAKAGRMLYENSGQRVGSVNRVTADGSAQLILNGKLVTVPAPTLSEVNGKLTTSLVKRDIGRSM